MLVHVLAVYKACIGIILAVAAFFANAGLITNFAFLTAIGNNKRRFIHVTYGNCYFGRIKETVIRVLIRRLVQGAILDLNIERKRGIRFQFFVCCYA